MATDAQDKKAIPSTEDNSFIIEEYKTIRDEIKATKNRIFLITSVGISAIPGLLAWVTKDNGQGGQNLYSIIFEASVPLLVISAMLIFLAEKRNLMRCGRYVRICIEKTLIDINYINKYPDHIGWEKYLESNNDENPEKKDASIEINANLILSKLIDKVPDNFIGKKFILSKKNFDNRAVDRLMVASFLIIFASYYILSTMIVVKSLWSYPCHILAIVAFCFYSYIGLLLGPYSMLHYHYLVSTAHQDEHKID